MINLIIPLVESKPNVTKSVNSMLYKHYFKFYSVLSFQNIDLEMFEIQTKHRPIGGTYPGINKYDAKVPRRTGTSQSCPPGPPVSSHNTANAQLLSTNI